MIFTNSSRKNKSKSVRNIQYDEMTFSSDDGNDAYHPTDVAIDVK